MSRLSWLSIILHLAIIGHPEMLRAATCFVRQLVQSLGSALGCRRVWSVHDIRTWARLWLYDRIPKWVLKDIQTLLPHSYPRIVTRTVWFVINYHVAIIYQTISMITLYCCGRVGTHIGIGDWWPFRYHVTGTSVPRYMVLPSVLCMYNEKRLDLDVVGLILVPGTNPVPRRHDLIPQMILYLSLCPQQMTWWHSSIVMPFIASIRDEYLHLPRW